MQRVEFVWRVGDHPPCSNDGNNTPNGKSKSVPNHRMILRTHNDDQLKYRFLFCVHNCNQFYNRIDWIKGQMDEGVTFACYVSFTFLGSF